MPLHAYDGVKNLFSTLAPRPNSLQNVRRYGL